jgi:hypothetical protein
VLSGGTEDVPFFLTKKEEEVPDLRNKSGQGVATMTAVAKYSKQLAWDEGLDPDGKAAIPHPVDDFGGFGEPEPYKQAPVLARIAVALIAAHPNRLGHLRQFALLILWAQTLGATKGAQRWWGVEIPRKLFRWVLGQHEQPDFAAAQAILVFAADACRGAHLTWWELEAVVYACLRTIEVSDEGGVRVLPFGELLEAEVVARYGTWSPRLKRLVEALTDGTSYQTRMDLAAQAKHAAAVAEAKEAGKAEAKAELRETLVGVLG